ncbi:hypothetical protein [Aureibacillus halotolerans]|uniref:Uncharacterized protein n=1 Tax=Aureibacillus halotolerans TaxID=1508390 RepID=A0A4R6TXK8_9BACI|nr:hypothetical protein [Aureibacillus halotolerans]TDQ38281.1 hypothetical protein EV213_11020 [Aureibacillus halotolerans]
MSLSTILKWLTGLAEGFLGIPIIGGAFILANGWAPLGFMLVVHIVVLLISKSQKKSYMGSVLGIITSIIGLIPIVGMIFHIITALVLLVDAWSSTAKEK